LVDDPRVGDAITLKPPIYVNTGDEDAITLPHPPITCLWDYGESRTGWTGKQVTDCHVCCLANYVGLETIRKRSEQGGSDRGRRAAPTRARDQRRSLNLSEFVDG